MTDEHPRIAVSITEAAKMLGVSESTVKRLIASGELRPIKILARTLITPRELAAFVAARERRRVA